MLAPETRVLLTDALRPPDGFRVDLAVATTYSLDLAALLLAPMSFALHETASSDFDSVDPIALLESLRRYTERTTVFCQSGGIHLPSRYSPLLQFLEQSVCEVTPRDHRRIFHPKVWLIRFTDGIGRYLHRVLVLSRNLTFDRCWDTLLRLDESTLPSTQAPDTGPLIAFLRELPELAAAFDPARGSQLSELCTSLAGVSFDIPDGFSTLEFLPLGLEGASRPFPSKADRALLISPFLDASAIAAASRMTSRVQILSRPESFDKIGPNAITAECWTLQRPAEIGLGDDTPEPERAADERASVRDGLHAKTFVFDTGQTAQVLTGSANLTSAGFGGNVEFAVLMTGPRASCGVASVWDSTSDSPGLSRLAERYEPQVVTEDELSLTKLEREIDDFHTELAIRGASIDVQGTNDDQVDLELQVARVQGPGITHVWPISLLTTRARVVKQDGALRWESVARRHITPFIAVETVIDSGANKVRRGMVIKAQLTGEIGDRRAIAMSEILRSSTDVLRYLAFLLADPILDLSILGAGESTSASDWERRAGQAELVILEPLLRASLRDDDALRRVSTLIQELPTKPDGSSLLPDGFQELWDAVWQGRRPVR